MSDRIRSMSKTQFINYCKNFTSAYSMADCTNLRVPEIRLMIKKHGIDENWLWAGKTHGDTLTHAKRCIDVNSESILYRAWL